MAEYSTCPIKHTLPVDFVYHRNLNTRASPSDSYSRPDEVAINPGIPSIAQPSTLSGTSYASTPSALSTSMAGKVQSKLDLNLLKKMEHLKTKAGLKAGNQNSWFIHRECQDYLLLIQEVYFTAFQEKMYTNITFLIAGLIKHRF